MLKDKFIYPKILVESIDDPIDSVSFNLNLFNPLLVLIQISPLSSTKIELITGMGKKLNIIWNMISHYKYVIVIVLGIVVVGFVDDNSFVQRVKYDLQISDIKDQIKAYDETYAKNAEALHELKRDPKTIEKIAREKYFMKTDDEDVFVLSDDVQFTKDDETTE